MTSDIARLALIGVEGKVSLYLVLLNAFNLALMCSLLLWIFWNVL
jgi:hypothetical protein